MKISHFFNRMPLQRLTLKGRLDDGLIKLNFLKISLLQC